MIDAGQIEMVYIRPLDLSVDETLYAIQSAIDRTGACRVVIDSLTAMENALAPTFKEDYAESLYRLTARQARSNARGMTRRESRPSP